MPDQESNKGIDQSVLRDILHETEKLTNVCGWYWDISTDAWTFSGNGDLLFGVPKGSLTFSEILAVTHPEDRSSIKNAYDRAAAEGFDFQIFFRIIQKDTGELRHIQSRGRVVTDNEGQATGLYGSAQDVTIQRKIDFGQKEHEARYEAVFNQHYQFLAILNPEGQVQDINSYALAAQGSKAEDYIGRFFWESPAWRDLPEWRKLVRQRVLQCQTMHEPLLTEDTYQVGDGTNRHADAAYTAIRDEDGVVIHVLAQANDTTARKWAEEALVENQRKIETLFRTLPGMAYRCLNDPHWTADYFSEGSTALTGYGPEDFVGNSNINYSDLIHPEDREPARNSVQKQLQQHHTFELSYRIITADDKVKWVWEKGHAVLGENGKVEALEGFINDITENKKIRELLTVSEQRFQELFDNSPVPLWEEEFGEVFAYLEELRNNGVQDFRTYFDDHPSELDVFAQKIKIIDANKATLKLHEAESKAVLMGNLENLFTAKSLDVFKEELIALASGQLKFESEGEVKTLNGNPRQIYLSLTIEKGQKDSVRGLLATTDITDRLQVEAELRQAQKMESVGRLAGGVAHDYNNALSVIMGFTELAMEKANPGGPLQEDLEQVLAAANRAAAITRQLLAFARKQTVVPAVLDLNSNVAHMLKMLKHLIGEDIDLVWAPGENLFPVRIDPSQIDQILANLCVNARDAIEGVGKITLETKNTYFDEAYCANHPGFNPGRFIMLAISDNGCGMDKDLLDNVFEPFFTTKSVDQGTGLGLATVFGIVKQNLGFINAYSEPTFGTTFKIYLPRHEHSELAPENETSPLVQPSRGETVLIVEDEEAILNLARIILEEKNYTVLSSGRPEEALRLAEQYDGDIDLLLTDVVMPQMNGRELNKGLQLLYPEIKTLFMSGYTANVIVHHGVLEDGVNFIPKPFSPIELISEVRKALD